MTWWTTVAGLTPLAIHDVDNVSGTQLLDYIGSNHITATSELTVANTRLVKSIAGNGSLMSYGSPVTLPENCTLCILYRDTGAATIVWYDTVSTGWLLDYEPGNFYWYIAKNDSTNSVFGTSATSDDFKFVTLVKTGLTANLYVNGVKIGGSLTDRMPPAVDRLGYGLDATYNFKSTDNIAAIGIWLGAATQAEAVLLEAACRAAFSEPWTSRYLTGVVGRRNSEPPAALNPPGCVAYADALVRRGVLQNVYAGPGQIVGTVKEKATPINRPLARRVRLYHERSGQLVAETWSNTQGDYTFAHIDLTQTYTAIAWDHTKTYRAVVADDLTPTRM